MEYKILKKNIEKLSLNSTIKNELTFHLMWIYRVAQKEPTDVNYLISTYKEMKKNSIAISKLQYEVLEEIAKNELISQFTATEYNARTIIDLYFEEILKYNNDLHHYTI